MPLRKMRFLNFRADNDALFTIFKGGKKQVNSSPVFNVEFFSNIMHRHGEISRGNVGLFNTFF